MVCRGLDVCKRFWALRRPASSRLASVGMVPRLARTLHPAHKLAFARRRWRSRPSMPSVTGGAPSRKPSLRIARRRAPRGRETATASQKHGGSDRPACEPASWRGADLPGAHRRKPASCRSRPRGAIGACRAALTRPRHEVSTVPRLSLPSARPLSGPLPGRRGRAAGPRVSRHGACRVAVKKKALF